MIGSSGGHQSNSSKKQKNGGLVGLTKQGPRGRVVPVPVAPPRLPPSSSSLVTTPTTTTTNKSPFTTGSSFEDSQADELSLQSSCSSAAIKSLDLEQGQLLQGNGSEMASGGGGGGGGRRTASAAGRRGQLSKLFSLQSDCSEGLLLADQHPSSSHSSFLPDSISSLVSGGIAALEDAFAGSGGGGGGKKLSTFSFGIAFLFFEEFVFSFSFCFMHGLLEGRKRRKALCFWNLIPSLLVIFLFGCCCCLIASSSYASMGCVL